MKKKISAEIIATIIVAALALAVAVFAIVTLAGGKNPDENNNSNNSDYVPSEELLDEMKTAATELVQNNYAVFKLFYTKGLPKLPEPYGNEPDDGSYTVDSDEYKTYSDIENFVKKVFIEEEARRILANAQGDNVAVYVDEKGALGISVDFKAMEYTNSWEQVNFKVEAVSDTVGKMTVTIHDADGKELVKEAEMQKHDGKWQLAAIIY